MKYTLTFLAGFIAGLITPQAYADSVYLPNYGTYEDTYGWIVSFHDVREGSGGAYYPPIECALIPKTDYVNQFLNTTGWMVRFTAVGYDTFPEGDTNNYLLWFTE